MNFHILTCVITEFSIMHYNKNCILFHCTVFEYVKFRTQFLIKHAYKYIRCSLLRFTCVLMVLHFGIWYNLLFIYRAKLWAEKFSRQCAMERAGFVHYKFLCWDRFLPTDFMAAKGIRLNRLAVPCGLESASHAVPQPSPPLLQPSEH
jgi:hypothetical protein